MKNVASYLNYYHSSNKKIINRSGITMYRKLLIICIGVLFCVVFFLMAKETVNTKMEFQNVLQEINLLTDNSVEILGKSPTLESVNAAKQFIEQQGVPIKEKLLILRSQGRIREKSEEYLALNNALDVNKIKIAEIYNGFVEKARSDIKSLDDLNLKLWNKSKRNLSNKEIEILKQKSKQIEDNNAVIEAMEILMKSYEGIS